MAAASTKSFTICFCADSRFRGLPESDGGMRKAGPPAAPGGDRRTDEMRAFNTLYPRSKVWLEDEEGNLVFGSGRLRILQAVRDTGSLYAAARELKMS